jgi:hypothetical protein
MEVHGEHLHQGGSWRLPPPVKVHGGHLHDGNYLHHGGSWRTPPLMKKPPVKSTTICFVRDSSACSTCNKYTIHPICLSNYRLKMLDGAFVFFTNSLVADGRR